MTDIFEDTVLPVHLAKRMVENRGGVATECFERLEIRRHGEWLASLLIEDGCVNYLLLCAAFAAR